MQGGLREPSSLPWTVEHYGNSNKLQFTPDEVTHAPKSNRG